MTSVCYPTFKLTFPWVLLPDSQSLLENKANEKGQHGAVEEALVSESDGRHSVLGSQEGHYVTLD